MGVVSQSAYLQGIQLFNSRDFFAAHEVLEDVWREAHNPEKKFLQALIQIAVALHHYSQGNHVGARSLLTRAHRNLENYPGRFGGVDLLLLRRSLESWHLALKEHRSPPEYFQIRLQA